MATEPNRDYLAVLDTDAGRIVLDLYETRTPITVNSFVFLARNHYFDGIAFHRVIEGFVAQGGDPNTIDMPRSTWRSGGPGYTFGLEIDPMLHYDRAGVLGMARGAARRRRASDDAQSRARREHGDRRCDRSGAGASRGVDGGRGARALSTRTIEANAAGGATELEFRPNDAVGFVDRCRAA